MAIFKLIYTMVFYYRAVILMVVDEIKKYMFDIGKFEPVLDLKCVCT